MVAARKLWDQTGNPPTWVSDRLGIKRWQLREAIHKIKSHSGIQGSDDVIIWDNGDVQTANEEYIGNIYDEI